jgi:hypothetical protein
MAHPNAYPKAEQPSRDFRNTVDVTQVTRALYVAPTTGEAFTVTNPTTGDDVTFYTDGHLIPVQTQDPVTITGHAVVYLY